MARFDREKNLYAKNALELAVLKSNVFQYNDSFVRKKSKHFFESRSRINDRLRYKSIAYL